MTRCEGVHNMIYSSILTAAVFHGQRFGFCPRLRQMALIGSFAVILILYSWSHHCNVFDE